MENATTYGKSLRLAPDIVAYLEAEQRPRETYSDVLRRLLGLDREPGSQGARTDAPSAEPAQP